MIDRWWEEAERNQVLPLDNRPFSELVFGRAPSVRAAGPVHVLAGPSAGARERGGQRPRPAPHDHRPRHHRPTSWRSVEGVLAVQGSVLGGWSFHLLGDGRLCYVHNLAGWRLYRVEADIGRLAPGDHTLAFRFTGPAADLLVDGEVVGSGEVNRTVWSRFSLTGAGLTAGWSPDFSPADEDYRGRFAFTGTLHRVDIDVAGDPEVDPDQEAAGRHAAQ